MFGTSIVENPIGGYYGWHGLKGSVKGHVQTYLAYYSQHSICWPHSPRLCEDTGWENTNTGKLKCMTTTNKFDTQSIFYTDPIPKLNPGPISVPKPIKTLTSLYQQPYRYKLQQDKAWSDDHRRKY